MLHQEGVPGYPGEGLRPWPPRENLSLFPLDRGLLTRYAIMGGERPFEADQMHLRNGSLLEPPSFFGTPSRDSSPAAAQRPRRGDLDDRKKTRQSIGFRRSRKARRKGNGVPSEAKEPTARPSGGLLGEREVSLARDGSLAPGCLAGARRLSLFFLFGTSPALDGLGSGRLLSLFPAS